MQADPDFEEKLRNSLFMMDIEDTEQAHNVNLDINIMSIIASVENIKQKRTTFKEYLAFIIVSMLIISLLLICVFTAGQKFFIYLEVTIAMVMPLSVIVFGFYAAHRERVKQ